MNPAEIKLDKILWLSIGVLLAGFPHWERLPLWIPVLHVLMISSRLYLPWKHADIWQYRKKSLNAVRLIVMISGVIGIYSAYGTFAGRDVGIALLVMLSSLKIFESQTERDFYISSYLGYFLVITNFFYEQTIPTAIYMFVVVIIMTASLISFNDKQEQLIFTAKFRLSAIMLLQSLPLLVILFILFPRVDGPLWGLPEDALTSVTGIDDQISPGSISKLVKSSEIAFRVKFEGEIPDLADLYWRGPVLWQSDGRKWTRGAGSRVGAKAKADYQGDPIHYNLMLEPTNKKWIFALEMNQSTPRDTYLTNDYQLKAKDTIQSRKIYDLVAYNNYRLGKVSDANLLRALALPEFHHKRSRELGNEWREQYETPEQIVNAALDWFRQQGFVYTLTPALTAGDTIDEFLFNTREGFCEYYAAAFTVLMRSAGIPTRIIAGYQGGEMNPVGNYLVVRQYHAHAWTEVWLGDQGWVRVDPTRVVSPNRIDQGIERALPEAVVDVPLGIKNSSALTGLWQSLRNSIDMINYQWAQWVLGYGPERQQMLMQLFGFGFMDWKKLSMILFTLLGVIIGVLSIYVLSRKSKADDPARQYYDRFCHKLSKVGFTRRSDEGPMDFSRRVIQSRQDLKEKVNRITALYIATRYGSMTDKLDELKLATHQFKTRKVTG